MIMIQRKNMKHHCILILRNPLEVIDTIRRKLKLNCKKFTNTFTNLQIHVYSKSTPFIIE